MSVLVVHDTPIQSGQHFNLLRDIFASYGIQYEIVSLFPQMSDKELRGMKPEHWLTHTQRLHDAAVKHQKVLCAGSLATAAFFGTQKGVPITKVRGRGYLADIGKRRKKRYTICTFSPSTCVKDADFFRDLCFDIGKLITNDRPLEQPTLEIDLAESHKDVKQLLSTLHDATWLGADIETTSFNPHAPSPNTPHVAPDILGIGFCALNQDDSGYVVVVPQKLIGREVQRFLTSYRGTFVFHNLKFDVQWLWRKFGRFKFHSIVDTMLMAWALDERPFNRYRHLGLDLLQRLYLDAPPKSVHMGDWLEEYFRAEIGKKKREEILQQFCMEHPEKARTIWRAEFEGMHGEQPDWRNKKVGRDIAPSDIYPYLHPILPKPCLPAPSKERKAEMWEQMLTYMGEDCYSTARLYPIFLEEMKEESERLMVAHQQYDIPASLSLANMELTGAPVDLPYLEEMKANIEKEIQAEIADIRALVQEFTLHPKGGDFNANSSKQVKEVLYDKEIGLGLAMPKDVGRYAYMREEGEVTTNSDTLKVLARQVAPKRPAIAGLINKILSYRVRTKILGTYIEGILDRVDPDGRVRGDFNLHGTATARISCSNPNLQNIPDASHVGYDIRRAYVPSEGWVILEADYSQLELRVAALFSQDQVLIEAYKAGADIHQEVAYMLWNKPKDKITKYERYLAKCMNFGVLYGRGARSIATGPEMDNLVEMSGRSWGNAEIDTYFAKFKEGYVDLFQWMTLVKKDSMAKQYVEQPTGHRRRFDFITNKHRGHIERQTVNTPIQGFAARMTIHALTRLDEKFDPEKQQILFTVHDSIMCQCLNDKDIIRETAALIVSTMQTELPEDAIMSLPALPHSPHQEGDRLEYNLPFVADVTTGPSWGDAHDEVEHLPVYQSLGDRIEDREMLTLKSSQGRKHPHTPR